MLSAFVGSNHTPRISLRSLEEIFSKEKEIATARKILKIVEESPFTREDAGVPIFSIQVGLSTSESYIRRIVSLLVEFRYLTYHKNSSRQTPRICLYR